MPNVYRRLFDLLDFEMPSHKAIHNAAKANWTPEPGDNPDNYWFYSSWAGFSAVCAFMGVNQWDFNHIAHQALCWSHGEWPAFIVELQRQVPARKPGCR